MSTRITMSVLRQSVSVFVLSNFAVAKGSTVKGNTSIKFIYRKNLYPPSII